MVPCYPGMAWLLGKPPPAALKRLHPKSSMPMQPRENSTLIIILLYYLEIIIKIYLIIILLKYIVTKKFVIKSFKIIN